MPVLLEGKVKYKEGKKWKNRFCVIWFEEDRRTTLELYILKDPAELCPFNSPNAPVVDSSLPSSANPSCASLSYHTPSIEHVREPGGNTHRATDSRNPSSPRDYIYGFESGRHLDKERCVLALIGVQTVHCMALLSLEEMFAWARILEKTLTDTHYHVSLVKCSMGSRLSAGTDGSLHVQTNRLCLVAEPAQGNKFICAWRFGDLESTSEVDYQERKCFQINAGKSAGKWRGQHIFSMDSDSLRALMKELETVKVAFNVNSASVAKESSTGMASFNKGSRETVDGIISHRSSFAHTMKACMPWSQSVHSPVAPHNDIRVGSEPRTSPISVSPSLSIKSNIPPLRHLISDSTTTLKTIQQKSCDVSPYHTDDIFSTDEDLKAEQQLISDHDDVQSPQQLRHGSLDNSIFSRYGGDSYTTTATSSGVSEDRRSLQCISSDSYQTGNSIAHDRSMCPSSQLLPSSDDRSALFHIGGQPLKLATKPPHSQCPPAHMCHSLELPPAWHSEASPKVKNRSIHSRNRGQSVMTECLVTNLHESHHPDPKHCKPPLHHKVPSTLPVSHPSPHPHPPSMTITDLVQPLRGLKRFSLKRRGLRTFSSNDDIHLLDETKHLFTFMSSHHNHHQQPQSGIMSNVVIGGNTTKEQSGRSTRESSMRLGNPDKVILRHPKTSASGQYPMLFGINEENQLLPSSKGDLRNVRHSYAGPSSTTGNSNTTAHISFDKSTFLPQQSQHYTKNTSLSTNAGVAGSGGGVSGCRIRAVSDHTSEHSTTTAADNCRITHSYVNIQQPAKSVGTFSNQARSPRRTPGVRGTESDPHCYINCFKYPRDESTPYDHWPLEMMYPRMNYALLDLSRSRRATTSLVTNEDVTGSACLSGEDAGKTLGCATTDSKPIRPQGNYAVIIPQDISGVSNDNSHRSPTIQKQLSNESGNSAIVYSNICPVPYRLSNGALPPFSRSTISQTNYASICGAKTKALSDMYTSEGAVTPSLSGGGGYGPTPHVPDRLIRSRSIASSTSTGTTDFASVASDLSSASLLSHGGKSSLKSNFLRFVRKRPEMSPPSGE